jgi:N4-gp56 family major capsid protein
MTLTKYAQLSLATTPLTENADVSSEAMSDSQIVVVPAEYGNVITTTKLANLQSGGKADLAAAQLVGMNMGRTQDKLGLLSLEATTNVLYVNGRADDTGIVAGDVMDSTTLNLAYNKLARKSIQPVQGGYYVAVLHDDVIHDIRAGAAAGDWTDVAKYNNAMDVYANEVGIYRGFRIIRDNHASYADQSGSGLVDVYKSSFFGDNACGKVESAMPSIVFTSHQDKLARFINIGWYGVFNYSIIDVDACWQVRSSSSVGTNAA